MSDLVKTEELQEELAPVISAANQIIVSNPDQYSAAADFLKVVKTKQKTVREWFEPFKSKAYAAWKSISKKETEIIGPLKTAEDNIKSKMLIFQREEEKKRLEEQRRLQAEEDARARKEQERLMKKAEKMKTPEKQEEYKQAAESIQANTVTVQKETPKVSGISIRKIWKARVINQKQFIEAALSNQAIFYMVRIDEKALDKYAKSTEGRVQLPGVEFYQEEVMAAGGVK